MQSRGSKDNPLIHFQLKNDKKYFFQERVDRKGDGKRVRRALKGQAKSLQERIEEPNNISVSKKFMDPFVVERKIVSIDFTCFMLVYQIEHGQVGQISNFVRNI